MRYFIVLLLLTAGCVHKKYAQDMLPDGKTWMVKAYQVPCDGASACKAEVKKEITARGKRICGAGPFRVISCAMKNHSYGTIEAHCLVRCGEKAGDAAEDPSSDALDKELN